MNPPQLSFLSFKGRVCIVTSGVLFVYFLVLKLLLLMGVTEHQRLWEYTDFAAVVSIVPLSVRVVREYLAEQQRRHDNVLADIQGKNAYLEHAAKILRHDMHSGINTYLPRGISSLERRLVPEVIRDLKLEAPLKLLKEGLAHTQKVYWGVYEFTNLVKQGAKLQMADCDLGAILRSYLSTTAYKDQVIIDVLPTVRVNEPLFCTAVDNLIRNGLKYNDSGTKVVAITMLDDQHLVIVDNGRGMSQADFEQYSKAYSRRDGQKEKGTGLGLNICIAILREHGFTVSCEKVEEGTMVKVKIR